MDQKLENELNLALNVSQSKREKTNDLDTGYNPADKSWELIIRYSGDIDSVVNEYNAQIRKLSGGYAIVNISEELIQAFSRHPEVIFIEKPKKLYFSTAYSQQVSCINSVKTNEFNLYGRDVIVAVLDSGIDYSHPDFLKPDGSTRIIGIYDEITGEFYSESQINTAIAGESSIPITDISGHGTHVASIAAGNIGVASLSDILVVRLGTDEYFSTARIMEAVDYVVRYAEEAGKPIAVNLSFGNNYGSHDGSSLLETYLNFMATKWRTVIVAGTGNEADMRIHTSGTLINVPKEIELIIGDNESFMNVQLWKNYSDDFQIVLVSPSGKRIGPLYFRDNISIYNLDFTDIYVFYGEPAPYSRYQEVFFQFIPVNEYIQRGIWKFIIQPQRIVDGRYDMWLPAGNATSEDTGFLQSTPDVTLTIPSTSENVISVGAYNVRNIQYADFSGRGYTRVNELIKPDIVASGVNVLAAAAGGGYTTKTGTSMAAPFVTGSAALLMEWGIINGNDLYLYGEKVKAYLIKGAKQLPGLPTPNPLTGWGALCVRDSLPV